MLERGARGFKCFLVHSGVDEFPNVDERAAARGGDASWRGTGAPLLVHAELAGASARAARRSRTSTRPICDSRPNAAEDAAIELLLRVCRETGARMHVVHLSSASALRDPRRARDENLPLTAETTPHYLHFDAESIPRGHTSSSARRRSASARIASSSGAASPTG